MLEKPRLEGLLFYETEVKVREGKIPEPLPQERIDAAVKRAEELLYGNKKGGKKYNKESEEYKKFNRLGHEDIIRYKAKVGEWEKKVILLRNHSKESKEAEKILQKNKIEFAEIYVKDEEGQLPSLLGQDIPYKGIESIKYFVNKSKMGKNLKETRENMKKYLDKKGNELKQGFYTDGIHLYHIEPEKNKPKWLKDADLKIPGKGKLEWIALGVGGSYLPVYPPELGIMSNPHILSKYLRPINPNNYLTNKNIAKARQKAENNAIKYFIEDCLKN